MRAKHEYLSKQYKAMIIESWVNNPDLSMEAIGKMHFVSESTVSRLIEEYRGKHGKSKTIRSDWVTTQWD